MIQNELTCSQSFTDCGEIEAMKKYKGEIALLCASFIWGTGFVAAAAALRQFAPFQILAIRFALGTLVLGAIFFKKWRTIGRDTLRYGITMGVLLIGGYAFQTTGLLYTTPAKSGFIVATSVVIVPFIGTLVYRRKVDTYNVTGAFVAMSGIAVMSFTTDLSQINIGDVLTLIGTFLFAFHLFYTSEFMSRDQDTASVVTIQFATCTCLASIAMFAAGQTDFSRAGPEGAALLLCLGLFNTALCFFLQTWAQKFTDETKAAIIISMECIFGAILSVSLGFEVFTARMFFGAVLILAGMLITEIRPRLH